MRALRNGWRGLGLLFCLGVGAFAGCGGVDDASKDAEASQQSALLTGGNGGSDSGGSGGSWLVPVVGGAFSGLCPYPWPTYPLNRVLESDAQEGCPCVTTISVQARLVSRCALNAKTCGYLYCQQPGG